MSNFDLIEEVRKSDSRPVCGEILAIEVRKRRRDGESEQQTLARCVDPGSPRYDAEIAKLMNLNLQMGRASGFEQDDHILKNTDEGHAGAGSFPPGSKAQAVATDADNLEAMVRAHMDANKHRINSKSQAYREVLATPKGREVYERDKQRAGIL